MVKPAQMFCGQTKHVQQHVAGTVHLDSVRFTRGAPTTILWLAPLICKRRIEHSHTEPSTSYCSRATKCHPRRATECHPRLATVEAPFATRVAPQQRRVQPPLAPQQRRECNPHPRRVRETTSLPRPLWFRLSRWFGGALQTETKRGRSCS